MSELTSTLTYMQANTNTHKMHTHTRVDTHFLIWPIKRRVFVNRENLSVVQTHTHTHKHAQQVQCWVKAVTFTT